MVEYNSDDSALTLGDDDSIAVGDYRIKYSSANDRFEVEHPNGEISDVPRSTSGSLVPQGLAESVAAGEALADDGNTYSSVQEAVNAASGWVFVGPGTFNESVTISTQGLTLEGSGYDTLIDGGTTGNAIRVEASNLTIKNLSVSTASGGGNSFDAIGGGSVNSVGDVTIDNVTVRESDNFGINLRSGGSVPFEDCIIRNCAINNTDSVGIRATIRMIISNCLIDNPGATGITSGSDDWIVANTVIKSPGGNGGISGIGNDNIVIGNRVINSSDDGISSAGTEFIVANNRVSDSSASDLNDGGTGTVLDGNLTGPSN